MTDTTHETKTTHPKYPAHLSALARERCECGGVRYYHGPKPFGCDDCPTCTEFRPVEAPTHVIALQP